MRFKAVFFDAGETLLGPHPSFEDVVSTTLAEQRHTVTSAAVVQALKGVIGETLSFNDFTRELGMGAWSTSAESSRQFWGTLYGRLVNSLGVGPEAQLVDLLYTRFTQFSTYSLFEDARPCLQSLHDEGVTLGVISNFEGWLAPMLDEMDVGHLFKVHAISGDVGFEKPDPRIFKHALESAGVSGEQAAHVGDHLGLDVEACAQAGITGVLIDRKQRHHEFVGPKVASLDQLASLLETL